MEYERHDANNSLSVPVYNTLAYEFDNAAIVYRAATPWNSPRSILQQALKQLEDADAQRQSKSWAKHLHALSLVFHQITNQLDLGVVDAIPHRLLDLAEVLYIRMSLHEISNLLLMGT